MIVIAPNEIGKAASPISGISSAARSAKRTIAYPSAPCRTPL